MDKMIYGPEKTYKRDECTVCGQCLAGCPYIPMQPGKAAREMARMRRGADSAVLDKCAGCATCDTICPNGCRPYSLIRTLWHERYRRQGLPELARFMMPHSNPNFRSLISLTPSEAEYARSLDHKPTRPEVLYTGCNTLILPGQVQTEMFGDLDIIGSLDWCCGEMYYRSGLFGHARQAGERLRKIFSGMKIERMVFVCSACYNMVANVFPKEFGIEFDFEKEFYTTRLLRKVRSGEITFKRNINKKVVMHDPCHTKWLPGETREDARELLRETGVEVVEPEHTRDEALCCGVAAGCSRFNPVDMFTAAARRLLEFDRSGAQLAATYCNGCLLTMLSIKQVFPSRIPLTPVMEILKRAAGEEVRPALKHSRAAQMLTGVALHCFPLLVLPNRRFIMPDIELP